MDGRTDMVKPVYPPTTSLQGGITTQADGNLSSSSRKAKICGWVKLVCEIPTLPLEN